MEMLAVALGEGLRQGTTALATVAKSLAVPTMVEEVVVDTMKVAIEGGMEEENPTMVDADLLLLRMVVGVVADVGVEAGDAVEEDTILTFKQESEAAKTSVADTDDCLHQVLALPSHNYILRCRT